ncbi:helicase-related protein [Paenibacillus monticola]|uniref:DEAD/DEAH box helicase n=1 Tax=Paenibacillus monticola TaxID=2666075 RepID=A0A7X2L2K3_9BACL|nr:helicase-related protein [Paenibacillus monticola]MRN54280.1 DEAD/DEAH box helicase [Paenibacillus monticola]
MKVAVYAVKENRGWSLWISLNLAVDRLWWSGALGGSKGWNSRAVSMVILATSLPLGWAVKLRDSFKSRTSMQAWGNMEWRDYIARELAPEVQEEMATGGRGGWSHNEGSLCQPVLNGWTSIELMEDGHERQENIFGATLDHLSHQEDLERLNLALAAEQLAGALAGRSLLQPELEAMLAEQLPNLSGDWRSTAQLVHLQGRLVLTAGILATTERKDGATAWLSRVAMPWRGFAKRRVLPRCQRCGSVATGHTACAACGLMGCAYCEACLALGRSRACALLLRSAALPAVRCTAGSAPTAARRWGLSAAQAGAVSAALGFLAEPRQRSAGQGPERFLLWAVTGAGKTEMVFPLLEAVLAAGGRALIATPRRDVVLELAPRLAKAFPAETLAVLYGGSPDRWVSGRLTLATTHQLLRFNQGFDLVIIDELDAYPYHNDPMLAYAAGQASKKDGSFLFLSATPPKEMQREANSGRLPHAKVPVRFHGQPLPVPLHLTIIPVRIFLKRGTLPKSLTQVLRRSLAREAQIFLFVSRIAHIAGLIKLLRQSFPEVAIEGTSSQDPARAEKVAAFRSRIISLLVTTTILERGVTVPRSDVFILDADSGLFDEASLVQMAGRAGRSKDDPAGTVVFASPQWSRSQRGAISHIRAMNGNAQRNGYISRKSSL